MIGRRGLVFLLWTLTAGCDDDVEGVGPGPHTYDGNFECADVDGDTARLVWNAETSSGSFGWIPSNGPPGMFVTLPITSLTFDVVFPNVLGLDMPGVAETVRLRFNLYLLEGGRKVSGAGSLTRASGTVEACNANFRLRTGADGGPSVDAAAGG